MSAESYADAPPDVEVDPQQLALAALQKALWVDREQVVGHGPTGTELPGEYSDGPYPGLGSHNVTLRARGPDALWEVHARYVSNGARVIESHTWGPLQGRLTELPTYLGGLLKELARDTAVRAADDVHRNTGAPTFVLDTARPAGDSYTPGELSDEELSAVHSSQAADFQAADSRGVLLQTFPSIAEIESASMAFQNGGVPVLGVSVYCSQAPDGVLRLPSGERLSDVVTVARRLGSWVGINCVTPADGVLAIKELLELTRGELPLYVSLNGLDNHPNDPAFSGKSTAYLLQAARNHREGLRRAHEEILRLTGGVAGIIVASCCFTDPEVTQEIATLVREAAA